MFNAFCLVIPLLVAIFMYYVFPGIAFCLLFSFVCPKAVLRIIIFCYLCFNLASSPSFIKGGGGERICTVLKLLWWWYLWRRVKFNVVPLDLLGIILGVDLCPHSMSNFRFMRMRFLTFFCRCARRCIVQYLRQTGTRRAYLKFCM